MWYLGIFRVQTLAIVDFQGILNNNTWVKTSTPMQDNGGAMVAPTGFTIIPSIFITPRVELVGMYSQFQTDGDYAIRLNQAAPNVPTVYPESRRYDNIEQCYFGVNHYIDGDDLKVMYGIEQINASGARADRPVSEEDAWAFRFRVQIRH